MQNWSVSWMLQNVPRWELIEWMALVGLRQEESAERDTRSRAEQQADAIRSKHEAELAKLRKVYGR